MFLDDSLSGEDVDLTKSDDENICDSGVKLASSWEFQNQILMQPHPPCFKKYVILDGRCFNKDQNLFGALVSTGWKTV